MLYPYYVLLWGNFAGIFLLEPLIEPAWLTILQHACTPWVDWLWYGLPGFFNLQY